MKNTLAFDRWFFVHVGALMLAGMIAVVCLGNQTQADEQYSAYDPAEVVQMPQSVPMGFSGFDRDVLLGHELEALEEVEAADFDSNEGDGQ